jgi:hypothetical protein
MTKHATPVRIMNKPIMSEFSNAIRQDYLKLSFKDIFLIKEQVIVINEYRLRMKS